LSEREIVCEDLSLAIGGLEREGFRLDLIYPADDPATALLSRGGEVVRLTTPAAPPLAVGLPPFEPKFVLTRAGASAGRGRAGMLYRDLIPGRLGGRYIASHITIPDGGPIGQPEGEESACYSCHLCAPIGRARTHLRTHYSCIFRQSMQS